MATLRRPQSWPDDEGKLRQPAHPDFWCTERELTALSVEDAWALAGSLRTDILQRYAASRGLTVRQAEAQLFGLPLRITDRAEAMRIAAHNRAARYVGSIPDLDIKSGRLARLIGRDLR